MHTHTRTHTSKRQAHTHAHAHVVVKISALVAPVPNGSVNAPCQSPNKCVFAPLAPARTTSAPGAAKTTRMGPTGAAQSTLMHSSTCRAGASSGFARVVVVVVCYRSTQTCYPSPHPRLEKPATQLAARKFLHSVMLFLSLAKTGTNGGPWESMLSMLQQAERETSLQPCIEQKESVHVQQRTELAPREPRLAYILGDAPVAIVVAVTC